MVLPLGATTTPPTNAADRSAVVGRTTPASVSTNCAAERMRDIGPSIGFVAATTSSLMPAPCRRQRGGRAGLERGRQRFRIRRGSSRSSASGASKFFATRIFPRRAPSFRGARAGVAGTSLATGRPWRSRQAWRKATTGGGSSASLPLGCEPRCAEHRDVERRIRCAAVNYDDGIAAMHDRLSARRCRCRGSGRTGGSPLLPKPDWPATSWPSPRLRLPARFPCRTPPCRNPAPSLSQRRGRLSSASGN